MDLLLERENPNPLAAVAVVDAQPWQLLAEHADIEAQYLRELAGVDDLEEATSLQLVVSATGGISHLGNALPNLTELNLNGSVLDSLRDLGTGFAQLGVLWVSRCGLPSLDGLAALPALRELYAAYNDISDIHPLAACTRIEVLDLEGNCVSDLSAAAYLQPCRHMQALSLSGNPVAEQPGYRAGVCMQLPTLTTLDDAAVTDQDRRGSHASAAARSVAPAAVGSAAGAAGSSSPRPAQQDAELAFVLQGIKHARVGVDSHEFREIEMSLLVASADGQADVSFDGARHASGTVMPASAGTWMRTLRSSREGNIAALRASQQASLRAPSSVSSPHATTPTSRSPSASRPPSSNQHRHSQDAPAPNAPAEQNTSSSAAGPRRASSNAGAAAGGVESSLPPRPVSGGRPGTSNPQRPFSARPGTSTLAAVRIGTSASTGASSTAGLYWAKHRLGSANSDTGPSTPTGAALEEDGVGPSGGSQLTYGSKSSFGGNLAKDLRKWKGGRACTGDGAEEAAAAAAAGAVGGGRHGNGNGRSAGGAFARGGQLDYAALLEELKRWKVETADRVLADPEARASGSGGDWGSVGNVDCTAAQSADILQLSTGLDCSTSSCGACDAPPSPLRSSSPVPPGAPGGRRSGSSRKMVLAKVVRDVGGAAAGRGADHAAAAAAAAASSSCPSQRAGSRLTSGSGSGAGPRQERDGAALAGCSARAKPSNGAERGHAANGRHSGPLAPSMVAGEVDVKSSNPRPIVRPSDSSDED